METDEPPDSETRYGIKVYVTGSRITPINNQKQDTIFLHQEYPYAFVEGHKRKIIRITALDRTTEEEKEGLRKACEFIEQQREQKEGLRKACEFIESQREQKGPKIKIHPNPYYYRDKRINL